MEAVEDGTRAAFQVNRTLSGVITVIVGFSIDILGGTMKVNKCNITL